MQPASRMTSSILLLGVAALALFPFAGSTFYIQLLTKIMIMAIFAMSLDLIVGYTGLVSLGHSAFFGFAGFSSRRTTRSPSSSATPNSEGVFTWASRIWASGFSRWNSSTKCVMPSLIRLSPKYITNG